MDKISIYRRMATKWLEVAERAPNTSLKRCYMERAFEYRTLATASEDEQLASNVKAI